MEELQPVRSTIVDQFPVFRVKRHFVSSGLDGLSPLQTRMLDDRSPVRVFSAPTGAGKSYAFQRAVVQRGQRVLFVVPTRRLAQNLARSLIEDLGQSSDASAARRVVVWTSDEREHLKAENPDLNVGRLRFRQLRGLELPEGGCMIVATPESIAWLVLHPSFRPHGAPSIDLFDLARFDHVVFDEFHTIEARGLGLASAVSRIVADVSGGARVTFLSATPIDIATPLAAFGVPADRIQVASEQIVTGDSAASKGHRALHGDVSYRFFESETMLGVMRANEPSLRDCLTGGRQIVVVFDSLIALNREKNDIAEWCEGLGVTRPERIAINSIDDSVTSADDGLYDIGRQRDPMGYRVLLATSSVEMGVTFRAGLMIMDPGYDAASFVQRAGRVARGDQSGEVIVRVTARNVGRTPWLRELMARFPVDGSSIEIEHFMNIALASAQRRFDCSRGDLADDPPRSFGSMPQRAAWCAAVFWAAAETAGRLRRGQRHSLHSFTPSKAKYVLARLREIEQSGLRSAKAWRTSFLHEALRFRMILPRIKVWDTTNNARSVPFNVFASHVDLLNAPAVVQASGEIEVRLDRPLHEVIRTSEIARWTWRVDAIFPHERRVVSLDEKRLRDAWLAEAKQALRSSLRAAQRKALEAACVLVRLSSIVPLVETKDPTTSSETVII